MSYKKSKKKLVNHLTPDKKLTPKKKKAKSLFGYLKGQIIIKGDIIAPTGAKWEAEEDE